jgi:long-chain acyl-CoA synthetase
MGGMQMSQAFLMSEQERRNLTQAADYAKAQSLPEVWAIAARRFSEIPAVIDLHSHPQVRLTYGQLYQQMQQFAAGLQALGIQPETGDDFPPRVALFADNSPCWLVADQGVMQAGAVDVVRGAQADAEELHFILLNSEAIALIVQDLPLLQKLQDKLAEVPLRFVILLQGDTGAIDPAIAAQFPIFTFEQVLERGRGVALQPVSATRATLASLMYTSGTSGRPKGVMLTHGNFIHQILGATAVAPLQAGKRVMSILPIWHAYERAFEYFIFSRGCTQIYTNIRHVKSDLKTQHPHYMVGVPRLWESIYEGIQKQLREQPATKQKLAQFFLRTSHQYIQAQRITQNLSLDHPSPTVIQKVKAQIQRLLLRPVHALADKLVYQTIRQGLGGQVQFVVSGGGSIADHLEDFFEVVGIDILGGYGLTETSPITNVRRPWRNLRGADGQPLLDTEIRIVDPQTRQPLPVGQQGLVLIRGPQVMQGYFRNPKATAAAIDPEGWFDSGDLGVLTEQHDLIITGRAKDTIVLSNGENIEPQPIEDYLLSSPLIDQIMLVGQDQKMLGALIVPNHDFLEQQLGQDPDLESGAVQRLFQQELTKRVKERPGFRPDERIGVFRLLDEPWTIDNGLLTQTLKIKRNVVTERYRAMIDGMFM